MTRTTAWTLFTAVALAPLAVGAQTPATTSPTTTSTAAYSTEKASDSKRVTGCIVAGTDGTYTFTESASASSPATAGDASSTAASSTASTAASATSSWALMANTDVDLSKYAGQRVELTGSSDHKGGMSADKTQSTTRSSNATTGPRFHVKSVKVLSGTCS